MTREVAGFARERSPSPKTSTAGVIWIVGRAGDPKAKVTASSANAEAGIACLTSFSDGIGRGGAEGGPSRRNVSIEGSDSRRRAA